MASHRFAHRPIYLQVCDVLTERIADGTWKPGQAIPNESDLARDLGVSTGTVRKALELMEGGRMLIRRQGRGTFVTDPAASEHIDRFHALRRPDGTVVSGAIEVVEIAQDVAGQAERPHLHLEKDDLVWRLVRLRRDGERVYMRERVALPVKLFPQVRADSANRIVALAHSRGLMLGNSEERIALGTVSAEAAAALAVPPDTPVLILDRVVRTTEGQPVEWRMAECHLGAGHYLAQVNRSG